MDLDLFTPSFQDNKDDISLERPDFRAIPQITLKQKIAIAFKATTRAENLKRIEADVRVCTPLKK